MNMHLKAVKDSLLKHGVTLQYKAVTEGNYNVETGSTTNTESTISFVAYPKAVKTSQYNYPNLIGKKVLQLLVAGDAGITPNPMDKVLISSEEYIVDSFTEHYAEGAAVLYKILVVKG